MKTVNKYLLIAAVATTLAMGACTDGKNEADNQAKDSDTIVKNEPIDVNGDRLYRGIIVDGSRSNINLRFFDDTLDFELPSDLDFTYEIGDSVSILVKTDSNGSDSIAEIQNLNGVI
ncbi:MAG: hypothetical protein IJ724_05470 [Muribaculaceae bacterium]|nr:hypothetical protein [Muribaculaceae bacterium]